MARYSTKLKLHQLFICFVQCDLARLDNASAFTLRLAGQTDFAKTTVRSLGTTTFMMSCIQSILNLFKRTARDWIS
jgi:hypothetical protein